MKFVGLIDEAQHGSVSGRSTVTQLIQQQKDILHILENGENLRFLGAGLCPQIEFFDFWNRVFWLLKKSSFCQNARKKSLFRIAALNY